MFQFPAFALLRLYIQRRVTGGVNPGRVSPFRNLRINARLPASRSLSQAPTSFVASRCQDIHRAPLVTWPPPPAAVTLRAFTRRRQRLPQGVRQTHWPAGTDLSPKKVLDAATPGRKDPPPPGGGNSSYSRTSAAEVITYVRHPPHPG